MALLEVRNLQAGYGKLQVLFDVSLSLNKGEIHCVVGPNGSGKSTLLKAIFGLANIYEGKVLLNGRDITRLKPHEKARMGMAYLPQLDNVFSRLTVRENLLLAGYTLDHTQYRERLEEVLDFLPQVRAMMNRKVLTLSGGERQMVAMAMAILRKPDIIMLDEPTAALAPKIARNILNKIVELRDRFKIGVLLVEQNAKVALEISDNAVLLVAGKEVYKGPASDLLSNKELAKMYLGVR